MIGGICSSSYSQTTRELTEAQRDSAHVKILRGNLAIENNAILKGQIKNRDSVISIQTGMIGILQSDISIQKGQMIDLRAIIDNQKVMITNEKKIGRKKGLFGILKGVGIGAIGAILLLK